MSKRSSSTNYVADTRAPSPADYLLFDLLDYHDELGERKAKPGGLAETFWSEEKDKLSKLLDWRYMMRNRPGIKKYLESGKRRER